jgi:hypothetical protein
VIPGPSKNVERCLPINAITKGRPYPPNLPLFDQTPAVKTSHLASVVCSTSFAGASGEALCVPSLRCGGCC